MIALRSKTAAQTFLLSFDTVQMAGSSRKIAEIQKFCYDGIMTSHFSSLCSQCFFSFSTPVYNKEEAKRGFSDFCFFSEARGPFKNSYQNEIRRFPIKSTINYFFEYIFWPICEDSEKLWKGNKTEQWKKKKQQHTTTKTKTEKRNKCVWQWGPTEIWTRIAGFKVQSANHYTMGPVIG